MSGENSKRSGELGEALIKEFFRLIGWEKAIDATKIPCSNHKKHDTISHGIDKLFGYTNPFLPGVSDIIHVSIKHSINGYPRGAQGIRTTLKEHLIELNKIVECAKKSSVVEDVIKNFPAKQKTTHRGLLVWVHSDAETIEADLRETIGVIELTREHSMPMVFIDSARASFIYQSIYHFKNLYHEDFDFYYPRVGSSISADLPRYGKYLPLELIASDIIPIRRLVNGKPMLHMYIRDKFSEANLIKAYALARDFGDAWVGEISLGFEDFNESIHGPLRDRAMLAFEEVDKNVFVFCFKGGLLSLLEKNA
jgi:hypothetical protein